MREPMPGGARRRLRRLAWFVALWLAGVATVAALAWLIRAAMGAPS